MDVSVAWFSMTGLDLGFEILVGYLISLLRSCGFVFLSPSLFPFHKSFSFGWSYLLLDMCLCSPVTKTTDQGLPKNWRTKKDCPCKRIKKGKNYFILLSFTTRQHGKTTSYGFRRSRRYKRRHLRPESPTTLLSQLHKLLCATPYRSIDTTALTIHPPIIAAPALHSFVPATALRAVSKFLHILPHSVVPRLSLTPPLSQFASPVRPRHLFFFPVRF